METRFLAKKGEKQEFEIFLHPEPSRTPENVEIWISDFVHEKTRYSVTTYLSIYFVLY